MDAAQTMEEDDRRASGGEGMEAANRGEGDQEKEANPVAVEGGGTTGREENKAVARRETTTAKPTAASPIIATRHTKSPA